MPLLIKVDIFLNLNLFNILHLLPLFGVGIYCAYTDLKYKKIFNRVIFGSLVYALLLYVGLFFYARLFVSFSYSPTYLARVLLNGGIALLVGYGLWYFKLWTAGDAKLFTIYALLIPLDFYSGAYLPYFPSFSLLINLFFPLLCFLALASFVSQFKISLPKEGFKVNSISGWVKSEAVKKMMDRYVFFIFIILFFQILSGLAGKFLGGGSVLLVRLVFLGVIVISVKKIESLRESYSEINFSLYASVFGVFVYFIIVGRVQIIGLVAKSALLLMVLMVGLRKLINTYLQKKEVKYKEINELSEGDSLSKHARDILRKRVKTANSENKQELKDISFYSLEKQDLKVIHNLFKSNLGLRVGVYKDLSFAPLLLGAALLTVVWRSSFVILLKELAGIL